MNTRLYTDQELLNLKSMRKRVANPGARWTEKPKKRPSHRQRNFQASTLDESHRFSIYQRHSLVDESDFSCGILYLPLGGPSLTLARYNGPSHAHGDIAFRPHIHLSSEKAIAAGRKPESEAEETDLFETPDGALACLIDDFNVIAITAKRDDQGRLPL